MFAVSCVACSTPTRRATSTREGLVCPACARFLKAPMADLEQAASERTALSTADGWLTPVAA